ncbi:MAG: hypothetical protein KDK45_18605, partial [Leptospiraceae bacterium]|nr:hypothetical protein [Leptospiraceae bacterium]
VDNLDYRRLLAAYNPKYLKLKEQTEGSHILDASLVFAAGLDLSAQGKINLKSPLIHLDEKPNGEWLESLLPDSIRLQPIKRTLKYRKSDKSSTSLFKATMYAERFLSLLVNTKGVRFGFTEERCTEYIKKDIEEELFENLRTFLFYREESLENYSLAQFRSKFLESGTIVLKLDRQKVKEYLQTSRLNDQLSILLESIRYTTQNKKILDEKNEFSLTKEKLISQKTKFEIYFKGKKLLTTSINMPYVDEWINIIKLFTKVKPEERHKSIYNYLREDRIENQYLHHSKRQKLSLPYEAGPSGGMRIQRQTPFGESVFQVQTGETSNIGFALDSDGKVDFSSPILDPIYTSGKVNTFKNSDRIRNEEYVYLDEWRKLQINEDQENNGIIEIQMSPATKARATLRVKISLQQFKKINHLTERESLKPILYSTKLYGKKDTEQFSKLSKFLDKYIEKQRDYITILDISDDGVTIEYVTDGFPSNLKTLYNLSKKTKKG